jgi:hypothetical protein
MKRTLTLALGVSAALLGGSLSGVDAAEVIITTAKGTQTYWTGFGPEGQVAQAQTSTSTVITETTVESSQPMSARQMQAKHLLGARVDDMQGKKVGQIEDIAFDLNGPGQFAVVKLSGDLAAGPRDFTPIPLTALRPTNDKHVYQLTVDRSRLQSASRFNVEQWPATSVTQGQEGSVTWGQEVYAHYGLTYDAAGATSANVVTQTGSATQSGLPFDYWEKSVDNGTAPDGKTTFPFLHDATDRHRASWR